MSRSDFIGLSVVLVFFAIATAGLVRSENSNSTTAKPSVRHPNYVRLLRTGQNDTSENAIIQNKTSSATKTASTTTTSTTAKPKTTTTKRSNSFSFSSDDNKIKSIVLNSDFETTERPRSPIGGFLSSLFGRSRLSFGSLGSSSNNVNVNSNKTSSRSGSSNSLFSGSSSSSRKNSTSSSSTPATGLSPGGLLAGVVKAVQNITITFEQMVTNFVKLFSFNGNGGGSRGNRLFGNNAS